MTAHNSLRTYTRAQLEHSKKSPNTYWLAVNNKVYDLSDFADDHPGGNDLIQKNAGNDVTDLLQDELTHSHSDAAYEMLEEYCIGTLETTSEANSDVVESLALNKKYLAAEAQDGQLEKERSGNSADATFLDLNKPLIPQMFNNRFTKSFYLEQVHTPRHLREPARFFGHPFLEVFTRTAWYVVPTVWIPVAAWCAYICATVYDQPLTAVAALFLGGVLLWTLIEYTLHRFLFHVDEWMPEWWGCYFLHFLFHGVHHFLPMDRLRLVMPPVLLAALAFPVTHLVFYLAPENCAYGIMSGAFTGYVGYDVIHYFLHHANLPSVHLRTMKTYHLAHHYKSHRRGFGITTKIWDRAFNTMGEA